MIKFVLWLILFLLCWRIGSRVGNRNLAGEAVAGILTTNYGVRQLYSNVIADVTSRREFFHLQPV